MSTPERARAVEELEWAVRRSTMYTVLLHHATASRAGLNVTDAQCINALSLDGPQTPGRLAELMGVTTGGAITAVIDRLESAGYVKRTRDPDDRRRVIVELVPEKMAHFARYFQPIGQAFQRRVAGYTDEQLTFLLSWFRDMGAEMPEIIEQVRKMP